MATDLLRLETNERVDLEDFQYAVDGSIQNSLRQIGTKFWTDPAKTQQFIINGFTISNTVAEQLTVTLGRAILGQRDNGQLFQGSLASEGEASRTIDCATLADGTYGIYIRFEYIDGESSSRAFWDPQGSGSEFAQTIQTRRVANWSMRLELNNPGGEWYKIGEVDVSGAAISSITDQRDFYFEGPVDNSYQSGWSSDGGGIANDRNSNRAVYGVQDLQTFTGAMRQCLEDLKGRGLRRWWERDIGGMNIGFDADPVEGQLAVGDADFYSELSGSSANLWFERSDDSGFLFDRTSPFLGLYISNDLKMRWVTSGAIIPEGLQVGFIGTPSDDTIHIGDANFYLTLDGNDPILHFGGTGGRLWYDRSEDALFFRTSSGNHYSFEADAFSGTDTGSESKSFMKQPRTVSSTRDGSTAPGAVGWRAGLANATVVGNINTDLTLGSSALLIEKTDTAAAPFSDGIMFAMTSSSGSIDATLYIHGEGHLFPGFDNALNLGSSSHRWLTFYGNRLDLSSTSSSQAAQIINSGTGYGLIVQADTSSNPAKSALRVVPQDSAPSSSPSDGDIYVDSDYAGAIRHHTPLGPSGADFNTLVRSINDGFTIGSEEGSYTSLKVLNGGSVPFPQSDMFLGQLVRVTARVRVKNLTGTGAHSYQMLICYGPAASPLHITNGLLLAATHVTTSLADGDFHYVHLEAFMRVSNPYNGAVSVNGRGWAMNASTAPRISYGTPIGEQVSGGIDIPANTTDLVIVVVGQMGASHANMTSRLDQFCVETI